MFLSVLVTRKTEKAMTSWQICTTKRLRAGSSAEVKLPEFISAL